MTKPDFLKLGPLWFESGVTKPNLATMMFAGFGTMAMISFMSFMQPYVLTELLQVPAAEQGATIAANHQAMMYTASAIESFSGGLGTAAYAAPATSASCASTGPRACARCWRAASTWSCST